MGKPAVVMNIMTVLMNSEAVYRKSTLISVPFLNFRVFSIHTENMTCLIFSANVLILILPAYSASRNLSHDFFLDRHAVFDVVEPFSNHLWIMSASFLVLCWHQLRTCGGKESLVGCAPHGIHKSFVYVGVPFFCVSWCSVWASFWCRVLVLLWV